MIQQYEELEHLRYVISLTSWHITVYHWGVSSPANLLAGLRFRICVSQVSYILKLCWCCFIVKIKKITARAPHIFSQFTDINHIIKWLVVRGKKTFHSNSNYLHMCVVRNSTWVMCKFSTEALNNYIIPTVIEQLL
jgi:hypothetical protein